MPVLINYKICDNDPECSGIASCPKDALFWDEKNKRIGFDESKCDDCGLCENACPIKAIRVARTREEYKKIEKEIKDDPREVTDLFVERYGAMPVEDELQLDYKNFKTEVLTSKDLFALEVFEDDSIECLKRAIPIKRIFSDGNVAYKKMEAMDTDFLNKYNVKKLPAFLFFQEGKLLGKVEGFYNIAQEDDLLKKIGEVIK